MNTGHINDTIAPAAWFETEAAAFMGAPHCTASDRLIARVVGRMRRRTRPESIISGGVFHAARVALYVSAAYILKLLFGVSIAVQHIR
jgi:hypothetical protein